MDHTIHQIKKQTNRMNINVTREQAYCLFFYEEFNKSDKPDL
jgi:hypothetical protein